MKWVYTWIKNNLSSDIVIFERDAILSGKAKNTYTLTVPLAILEVEIFDENNIPFEPYTSVPMITKTERLLTWGVGEIVWIYPQAGKITHAKLGESSWKTTSWMDTIELLAGYQISIGTIVRDYGVSL